MKKVKFKYNPESLSYEEVKVSGKQKFKRTFIVLVSIALTGVLLNVGYSAFFDSAKEKTLKRENVQMRLQYDLMSKRLDHINKVLDDVKKRDDNIYRVIFEAEPIPDAIREAGFGGVNRYTDLEKIPNSRIVVESAKKLDKITRKLVVQSKSYDEVEKMVVNNEDMLASIPAIQPISNKDLRRTASGYGWRIHPIYKIRKFHKGMDFTASTGTEVYATGDAKVQYVSFEKGYGNFIVLDHGYGYKTLYAHLSSFNVRRNQKIKRGDVIGFVGNTGQSVGPHLHYEVHKDNKKIDPINYYFNDLTPNEYEDMILIASNFGQSFD